MMMVWSARNVVHSGLIGMLKAEGIEPVLLFPEFPSEELVRELRSGGARVEELLDSTYRGGRVDWFVDAVLSFAIIRRNAPETYRVRRGWYERDMAPLARTRHRIAAAVSSLFVDPKRFALLRTYWERRSRKAFKIDAIARQLTRIQPDALWFSYWGMGQEAPYVVASRKLQIPAVTSLISFDYVLTKGVRPLFDHYLVWSQRIATDLLKRDPRIKKDRVSVTGTPQFDFHKKSEMVWDRSTTLKRLGLPPESRYLVYGAGRKYHSPGEVDLVNELAIRVRKNPKTTSFKVVVRLHPLDDRDRWKRVTGDRSVVVSDPFRPPVNTHGWSWSSLDDQALLVSSLFHADACLSVASTIALDAAVVGTPAIGLRLDQEVPAIREVCFDGFDFDHYRPLVASGGVQLARSWSQLLELLERAIENPDGDREVREKMVEDICGSVDGRCGQRTAQALLAFIEHATRKPGAPE
jgi:hypothetical protein